MGTPCVTPEMVREAQVRLKGIAQKTGLSYSNSVSHVAGCQVYLKMENLQRTGSFKLRGAYNKVAALTDEERAKGVIAASAGNHAQGVALAATSYGCKSIVCMPKHAPLMKIAATKGYGAEVVLHGDFFDEAAAKAQELSDKFGYTYVHPFNDPYVMAGPIGGGGLISGIAVAAKSVNPKIRIIGVQSANMPSMQKSVHDGAICTYDGMATLADGIAVKRPGDLTYAVCRNYVDDIVTVDEGEIAAAILWLIERVKTVSEGAGATPVAALMNHKILGLEKKKVVAVISGGNIDVNNMTRIINSGLTEAWRKACFTTVIPDRPGELVRLLSIIAESGANVLAVTHERSQHGMGAKHSAVTLELETANEKHVDDLKQRLINEKYEVIFK